MLYKTDKHKTTLQKTHKTTKQGFLIFYTIAKLQISTHTEDTDETRGLLLAIAAKFCVKVQQTWIWHEICIGKLHIL